MEKKKAKFDFELMNSLGHLKDEEFKVAYYILNTIGMSSDGHPKIYRAVLADLCNKSERTISRITDKLDELGIITKDVVSDGNKKYNFYSVPRQKTKQNLVMDDTFNKSNKSNKIEKRDKIEKREKTEKTFGIDCEVPQEEIEQFCKEPVPDEEDLSQYLRRVGRLT